MRRYKSSYFTPRSLRKRENKNRKKLFWTILIGGALFLFLLVWGLPYLIGSLSIFNKLKPASEKQQIEDAFLAPPVLNIPYEATSSASIRINGYSTPDTEVKIYLDEQLVETVKVGEDGSFTTNPIDLNLGINNIYSKTVNLENKESLPSKTIQVTYRSERPKLEVSEPPDGKEIKGGDKKTIVSGQTDFDSEITVGGIKVIVGIDGKFSREVSLNDGENIITIEAINPVGSTTSIQRKVIYTP